MSPPVSFTSRPAGFLIAALVVAGIGFVAFRGAVMAEEPATPAGCTSAESQQFDFWVGRWRVTENGAFAGRNDIQKIDGGCALLESWTSADGVTGHSLNIYDARRGLWHQTWVDGRGALLLLEGAFSNGAMTLAGVSPRVKDGQRIDDRITWTPLPNGDVRQHWETSSDGKQSWSTAFDGLYRREVK
jgi:hypothetical protein